MHERATYDTGGSGHPEIEDLAALLDGKLSAEEAASLRAHLARCEPCLALLAETASFLGADADMDAADVEDTDAVEPDAPEAPLPFKTRELPRPTRQRSRRWAPAAAAVAALAVATVLYHERHLGPPRVEVARLVESLAGRQAAVAGLLWGPVQRGASAAPDDRSLASFRLGVELVNLDVGLALGDGIHAASAAANINGLLKGTSADLDTKRFFSELPARIMAGAPLAALAEETRKVRPDLEGYLAPADYDFGRWAEAGRLAAGVAQSDFLTARDTRRFPGALRGRLGHPLAPKAGVALDEIAAILDKGDLTAADYKTLDAKFREILATYYPV